jgi:hypothetical protein
MLPLRPLAFASLLALPTLVGCAAEPPPSDVGDEAVTSSEESLSTGVSLVVRPLTAGLQPQQWHYVETATRKVIGCYDYDVLQGSGWYLATWRRTYDFVAAASGPTVNLQRTLRASACAARMAPFNEVTVSLATAAGPVEGFFRVLPTGATASAAVTCTKVDSSFVDSSGRTQVSSRLACTDAAVKVPTSGAMTVTVTLAR